MDKITANHPLSKSEDIIKQNLEALKALFPTIVKEGRIDVEELKALLGEELETNEEYYRFTWAGKSQARQEANKPSTGTLRPVKEESKDWDTTQNVFIEGDNLEVLKLLQKSYANKIKMIYIDPPYNTGNDFVYKDNYADNLGNYLEITGQADDEGKKLSTNTESDGRYHSNWLNMIYPRLKLARNLLKEDGVIFISIDDNEVANLRKVCDETFGEENFIGSILWKKKTNGNNMGLIPPVHDYFIGYSKSYQKINEGSFGMPISQEYIDSNYSNPDNHPKGAWSTMDLSANHKGPYFEIKNPITGEKHLPSDGRYWVFNEEEVLKRIADGRIIFGKSGKAKPVQRVFLADKELRRFKAESWWDKQGLNSDGTAELKQIFGIAKIFDHSKPSRTIKELINISTGHNDLVLDFFAGSGTTADAVMQINSVDGGNRKFICVQLAEPTDEDTEACKAGYKTLSDLSKERICRAGEKIKSEIKEDLFTKEGKNLDIGFRVFKLDTSNINAWDGNVDNFEQTLLTAAENIKPDRSEEDVLFEILLKSGLDLTQPIEERTIAGKKVFNIGIGALFVCQANDVTTAVAEGIGKWKEALSPSTCRVIFKDTGFNDVEKTNSIQILKQYGINEVNTI